MANVEQMEDENVYIYHVLPLGFSSTTIKRVCRSTLQAETYSLQSGIESGDKIRALIAETKGCLYSCKVGIHYEIILCPALAIFGLPFALRPPRRRDSRQISDSGLSWPQFMRTCGRDLRGHGTFARTEGIVLTGSALTRC